MPVLLHKMPAVGGIPYGTYVAMRFDDNGEKASTVRPEACPMAAGKGSLSDHFHELLRSRKVKNFTLKTRELSSAIRPTA